MTSQTVLAYLGLGSNLGDRVETLQKAIQAVDRLPFCAVTKRSEFYETAPQYVLEQPMFLNAVIALRTTLPPETLLSEIQAIEIALGRKRDIDKGPRTIDLDILLYGDLSHKTPSLQIPHPAIAERSFVLVPLAEIARDLQIPGIGKTAWQVMLASGFDGEISRFQQTDDREK